MAGDPVIDSEFLFQAFFGEFFRIKEISRIFIKLLYKYKIFTAKEKELPNGAYYKPFNWVYEIHNMMIHHGISFKNYNVTLPTEVLENISEEEMAKFKDLLQKSNDRDGTVEIQCAFYAWVIKRIMDNFFSFQEKMGQTLGELIILYEDHAFSITVSDNIDEKSNNFS